MQADDLVSCSCNYSCRHETDGFKIISVRLKRIHDSHDKSGRQQRNQPQTSDLFCPCSICKGQIKQSIRTIQRHKKEDAERLSRLQEAQARFNDMNIGSLEGDGQSGDDDVEGRMEVDEGDSTLENNIVQKLIELQKLLDSGNVSITLQTKILRLLFGKSIGDGEYSQFQQFCLMELMRKLPEGWDGKLEGSKLPASFRDMFILYRNLGMIKPRHYRLCTGTSHHLHEPILLPYSREDETNAQCTHGRLWSGCSECRRSCTECGKQRKDVLSFDYIPLMEQLALLCKSRTYCDEFLTMWKSKDRWLNKQTPPDAIHDVWDGAKVREWSDFWNPETCYELPIVCEECKKTYATFPENAKSKTVKNSYDEENQVYKFICECSHWVIQPKKHAMVSVLSIKKTKSF